MKKLAAIILMGVTLLNPISIFAEEQNSIDICGYCFSIPEDFQIQQNSNNAFEAIATDGINSATIKIGWRAEGEKDDAYFTIDYLKSNDVIDMFKNAVSETFNDTSIIGTKDYSAGMIDGSEIDFTYVENENSYNGKIVLIPAVQHNNFFYAIFTKPIDCSDELYNVFDDFMKSATIENVAETEPSGAINDAPFDDLRITFQDSMHNDVTGTWRLARVLSTHPITDYIQYYYENYMVPHEGVHVVVDFGLKTTAILNYIDTMHLIDISIYEYVEGDELDAKACPQGMRLGWYQVNTDTWEVTEL